MTQDMTTGKPLSLLVRFSIPLLLGNLFQQLYNLVDTVIVGRYLGITALTAVGATASVNYLVMGFVTGVCSGFAIPIAQQFGAKEYGRMRRFVANASYLALIFAGVMTLFTAGFCRQIFQLVKTPADILSDSCGYMIIIFAGLPFTFLYNLTSGIIRALGDSKTPFYFLAVATVVNILLDFLFILHFHMGVEGAAYATVLAQSVSGIGCFFYMKKRYELLRLKAGEGRISRSYLWKLTMLGVPLGLQSSITAIGSVLLQGAVNTLGMTCVSAYTALTKIKQFTICPYGALDIAMATYTSQNYGAQCYDRVKKGIRAGFLIYGIYSAAMAVLLTFWGDNIALIFVDASETEILAHVKLFFQCCGVFYLVIIVLNSLRSVIQGLGYGVASMLAGVCELAARSLIALFLVPSLGYLAICFTDAAAWILAGICVLVMYVHIWKKITKEWEEKEKYSNIKQKYIKES